MDAIIRRFAKNTTEGMGCTEARGKEVFVTLCGGDVVRRIVWEDAGDVVYLCSRHGFEKLQAGLNDVRPVGFPKSDIRWG